MRYYYAQIDDWGVCAGVIETHAEMHLPHMVPIESADPAYIGRTYTNGEWEAP